MVSSVNIRKRILKMACECDRNVHIGGAMSMVEILTVLYRDILSYNVSDPYWEERDRFILSKGHCVLGLYAALAEAGVISEEDLSSYMQDGSMFGSHPVMNPEHGIECSSGSLGQGISMALGIAKAAELTGKNYRVYALVGNGECDEGAVWEAFMLAGQWKLTNFTIIIDNNGIQSDGESRKIIDLSNLEERLSGFGLKVYRVNGHDENELKNAFEANFDGTAKVVVCDTIKGRGVSFMENNNDWHHNRLIRETYEKAMKEIEGAL